MEDNRHPDDNPEPEAEANAPEHQGPVKPIPWFVYVGTVVLFPFLMAYKARYNWKQKHLKHKIQDQREGEGPAAYLDR
ncbi:hypothetical protein KIPB_003414, partial [Kipferlia bialata]|eukprot:g3414.t1